MRTAHSILKVTRLAITIVVTTDTCALGTQDFREIKSEVKCRQQPRDLRTRRIQSYLANSLVSTERTSLPELSTPVGTQQKLLPLFLTPIQTTTNYPCSVAKPVNCYKRQSSKRRSPIKIRKAFHSKLYLETRI